MCVFLFFPSSLFILLCYPQTWQHLSGVWHGPHQTKHKDLLLYCYSLWRPLESTRLEPTCRGMGEVIPSWVGFEGHQESKRLCDIYINISTVATAAITTLIHIDSLLYTFNQPGNTTGVMILWSAFYPSIHLVSPQYDYRSLSSKQHSPPSHTEYCIDPFTSF